MLTGSLKMPCPQAEMKRGAPESSSGLPQKEPKAARLSDVDLPEGGWCSRSSGIGVFSKRGQKQVMEDAWAVGRLTHLAEGPLQVASVFDGHGGRTVSSYCSRHLHERLAAALALRGMSRILECLTAAFLAVDAELKAQCCANLNGSTATTCALTLTHIYVASVGDSRAVLARGGQAIELTMDHSPKRADELARITAAGGAVLYNSGLRVMGALAMTRAIGDHALQRYGISPEPELMALPRCASDDFLIIASDGLWAALRSCEVVEIVTKGLQVAHGLGLTRGEAGVLLIPRLLARTAVERGSKDDVAVVFIDMRVKPAPAQKQQDDANEALLGQVRERLQLQLAEQGLIKVEAGKEAGTPEQQEPLPEQGQQQGQERMQEECQVQEEEQGQQQKPEAQDSILQLSAAFDAALAAAPGAAAPGACSDEGTGAASGDATAAEGCLGPEPCADRRQARHNASALLSAVEQATKRDAPELLQRRLHRSTSDKSTSTTETMPEDDAPEMMPE